MEKKMREGIGEKAKIAEIGKWGMGTQSGSS